MRSVMDLELGEDISPQKASKLTDTKSNQMLAEEEVNLGEEEKQDNKDIVEDKKDMKLFDLPVEILPSIFKLLDPASLKNS